MSHFIAYNDHGLELDREAIKQEIKAFAATGKMLNERPSEMSYDAYRVLMILQKKKIKSKNKGELVFAAKKKGQLKKGETYRR